MKSKNLIAKKMTDKSEEITREEMEESIIDALLDGEESIDIDN